MKDALAKVWAWMCEDTQERVIWTAIQAAAGIASAYAWDPAIGVTVAALLAWVKAEAKKHV